MSQHHSLACPKSNHFDSLAELDNKGPELEPIVFERDHVSIVHDPSGGVDFPGDQRKSKPPHDDESDQFDELSPPVFGTLRDRFDRLAEYDDIAQPRRFIDGPFGEGSRRWTFTFDPVGVLIKKEYPR